MYQFLIHSNDIQNSVITESEAFSDEMLKLSFEDILIIPEMLDRIVKYYNATYKMHNF